MLPLPHKLRTIVCPSYDLETYAFYRRDQDLNPRKKQKKKNYLTRSMCLPRDASAERGYEIAFVCLSVCPSVCLSVRNV